MACAAAGQGVTRTTSPAARVARRILGLMDGENAERNTLGVLVRVELDRELAASACREVELGDRAGRDFRCPHLDVVAVDVQDAVNLGRHDQCYLAIAADGRVVR